MMLGYDIRSLAPDISYSGEVRPKEILHQLVNTILTNIKTVIIFFWLGAIFVCPSCNSK
jgi:hypothetical protein